MAAGGRQYGGPGAARPTKDMGSGSVLTGVGVFWKVGVRRVWEAAPYEGQGQGQGRMVE